MERSFMAFWMAVIGTGCWGVNFWWMHRLSANQNALLMKLREQTQRIEKLTRVEHDLIKDVHPQVGEINKDMQEIKAAVLQNTEKNAENTDEVKRMKGEGETA